MTRYKIPLITLDHSAQARLGLGGYDPGTQLLGHRLHNVLIQT